MKKILSLMATCLGALTLVSCQSKLDTSNKTEIRLDNSSYKDYIDVDIEIDKIDEDTYYRWVVTPFIPYENYLFKNGSILTKGNFQYDHYVNDGELRIDLNQYGYAKSKWIQIGKISFTNNIYQYLDENLEIIDVEGNVYF